MQFYYFVVSFFLLKVYQSESHGQLIVPIESSVPAIIEYLGNIKENIVLNFMIVLENFTPGYRHLVFKNR